MERFREVQSLRQSSLVVFCLLAALAGVGICFYTSWLQGPQPILLLAVLVIGAVAAFLLCGELRTAVHDDALLVQFFPITRPHRFPWSEIASAEARRYRPLREYGGWGVRWGASGRVYSVSGNQGVQLVLADGKRVMIGSRRADALALAIEAARSQVR